MSTEEGGKIVPDEWDRFETEVYKKITDGPTRELVKDFIGSQPRIKNIDPNQELKKAEELMKKREENERYMIDAMHGFRVAAYGAFWQELEDVEKFWNAYKNILGEVKTTAQWGYTNEVNAYEKLRQRKDIMKILIDTYNGKIGAPAKVKIEKSMD